MKKVIDLKANGKLLLTGEYLVLAGGLALALPVRFGQHMKVYTAPGTVLSWESRVEGKPWFSARLDVASLAVIQADNKLVAAKLRKMLLAARKLNPSFPENGAHVVIDANYPLAWGLGSSSSLTYLLAIWAGTDPYRLYRLVSKGSGYDLACASRDRLLFYRLDRGKPEITSTTAGAALRSHAVFAYLGKKQDSAKEVARFLETMPFSAIDLVSVSRLTEEIARANTAGELISLVREHEYLLSTILGQEPLSQRFPSFTGAVKSLGAWGGDFAMFVGHGDIDEVRDSVNSLGFRQVFSYSDLEIPA